MSGGHEHHWGSAPDFFGPRHEYRESLLLRRFLPMLCGRRILNAGAGAGSMTKKLVARGFEVTSVEESPALVARVRSELTASRPGGAHAVEVGDLEHLRLDDAVFDGVVCAEVLEHLDDDRAAARHLARVLVPGGAVVVSVPANPRRYDWVDKWAGHRRRYAAPDLERLLAQAGLVDVKVTAWGFPLTGLYHRHVYTPMLHRRLQASGTAAGASASRLQRMASPLLRAAFEVDTLFLGRAPGYFGLIATARAASTGSAEPVAPSQLDTTFKRDDDG